MSSLLDYLIEPLRHGFMIEAMLVAAFVGVVCASLSCFIVLKGWSLTGDAVSHAVLPGVILAWTAGLPMAVGAVVSGFACVVLAGAIKAHSPIKEDAVLGAVFAGFFAVGLILLAASPSDVHFMHVLFGNVLGIERDDLIQTLVVGTATLAIVIVRRRDLLLFCFDPIHAQSIGLGARRLHYLLLALLALATVASLQAVGVILVVAMLVTPGATGLLMTDRFDRMLAVAIGSAVFSSVFGTLWSFWLDGATGACIVLVQTALFALAFVLGPKKGLLARRRVMALSRTARA